MSRTYLEPLRWRMKNSGILEIYSEKPLDEGDRSSRLQVHLEAVFMPGHWIGVEELGAPVDKL